MDFVIPNQHSGQFQTMDLLRYKTSIRPSGRRRQAYPADWQVGIRGNSYRGFDKIAGAILHERSEPVGQSPRWTL